MERSCDQLVAVRKLHHSPQLHHADPVKYVLRQAAKRYLDPETSARPKLGFPIPIRVWMREEKGGYEKIRKVFAGETAGKYFYQDKLLKLLDDHKNGKADNSRKIWTVYAFCVWYDVYFCRQA